MSTPRLTDAGSRFSNMNISENSKSKSERLERQCKGPRPKRFMQKHRKNWFIAMSLEGKGELLFLLLFSASIKQYGKCKSGTSSLTGMVELGKLIGGIVDTGEEPKVPQKCAYLREKTDS